MKIVLTLRLTMLNKTGIYGHVMWLKCYRKNQHKIKKKKKLSLFTSPNHFMIRLWFSSPDFNVATYHLYQKYQINNTTYYCKMILTQMDILNGSFSRYQILLRVIK